MKKKVLIFGGLGFIGTNLTEELVNRGEYDITIFEAENVCIQNPRLLKKTELFYGDFNNIEDYESIFKEKNFDWVFHLIKFS